MIVNVKVCKYCKKRITPCEDGSWIDETGGDCCDGDDAFRNEGLPHVPE